MNADVVLPYEAKPILRKYHTLTTLSTSIAKVMSSIFSAEFLAARLQELKVYIYATSDWFCAVNWHGSTTVVHNSSTVPEASYSAHRMNAIESALADRTASLAVPVRVRGLDSVTVGRAAVAWMHPGCIRSWYVGAHGLTLWHSRKILYEKCTYISDMRKSTTKKFN
jgi:hypothetical protein